MFGSSVNRNHHLFNQPIAKDAEQKNLRQGIDQITYDSQCVDVHLVDLCGLIGQERQHDGRCQHVKQQSQPVCVTDCRDES